MSILRNYFYTWIAVISIGIVLTSCSPYNGNRQHDTIEVAKRLGDRTKSSRDFVLELMECGYDSETAHEIVNDAFYARLNGDY